MNGPKYPLDEIAERGEAIYREKLKPLLEPEHIGKRVIIDIETGDYEVDDDEFAASKRIHDRRPNGEFYGMRVGYRAAESMGRVYGECAPMITGRLNRNRQAVITVTIHGQDGQKTTEVIIDTAFSGHLALPLSEIAALKLVYNRKETFLLGGDREERFDIYAGAEIEMDGRRHTAFVLAAEGNPMVGLALMDGYRLCLDFENNGEVRIELLPPRRRRYSRRTTTT